MNTVILTFCLISSFASFIISFFLLFQWKKQVPKNNSTLTWSIGLLVYSVSHFLAAIVYSNIYKLSPSNSDLLQSIRLISINLFFLLIYWGTMRLIFRSKWWIYGASIIGFITISSFALVRNLIFPDYLSFLYVYSFAVLLPISLIFLIIFLMLSGILMGESVKRNKGALIISFSWLIYTVSVVILPFIFKTHLYVWYGIRAVSTLVLLVGLTTLQYEARQALSDLEEDKGHQHHFK